MTADEQLVDQVAEKVRLGRMYVIDGSFRLAATCFQHAAELCLARNAEVDREIADLIDHLNTVERA